MSSAKSTPTPVSTIENVGKPLKIAMNQNSELVVVKWSKDSVSTITTGGERLKSIKVERSTDQDRMIFLSSVALDGEGNVFITDRQNYRIHKFTPDGTELAKVGTKGNGPLEFRHPADITYSAHTGKLYVVDRYHRVQVINPDLTFCTLFGRLGREKGALFDPSGVALDNSGKIHVVDAYNHRVQVFTEKGELLSVIGTGDGEFGSYSAKGITVDGKGRVYVSDMEEHRVSIFDPNGKFLTSIGRKGKEPGEFNDPRGMMVDDNGLLYVCDFGNDRTQVFDTASLPL